MQFRIKLVRINMRTFNDCKLINIMHFNSIFYYFYIRDESSGSSLLSTMKKRNGCLETTEHERQMLNTIRQYFLENNQSVNTDQIVKQFRNKYSTEDTPLFKSLLSEICTFNRCPDKTGVWTLKPKYC